MYTFGGCTKKQNPTNDLCLLNLSILSFKLFFLTFNTLEWSKIHATGVPVSARYCHSAAMYMYSDMHVQPLWTFYFNCIPDDVTVEIFSYLSPQDLLNATKASKLFWYCNRI
jgi:hypothetical protein